MSDNLVEFNNISKFFGSVIALKDVTMHVKSCLLYTSPSPRDVEESRMPSSG